MTTEQIERNKFLDELLAFCKEKGYAIVPTHAGGISFHDRMKIIPWDSDVFSYYKITDTTERYSSQSR